MAREFIELKEGRRYYSVWNHSQGPIYNVCLGSGRRAGWHLEAATGESIDTEVLRPGESLGGQFVPRAGAQPDGQPLPYVAFTDGSGARWQVELGGELRPVGPPRYDEYPRVLPLVWALARQSGLVLGVTRWFDRHRGRLARRLQRQLDQQRRRAQQDRAGGSSHQ